MKYIFFTGGTGGLGIPCVKTLSERGYTVFAAGTNEKKLAEIGKLKNVIPVLTDITDTGSVKAAYKTVETYTTKLHAVVNFAGLTTMCSMVEGDCISTAERLLEVNVMGMIRVNRIFFDLIYAGSGRIINCSSEAGWMTPQPFVAPYFFTKHAVEAYNDSLRRELMHLGVPVIKIQPGAFKTAILDSASESFEKMLSETTYHKKVLVRMKPMMVQELNKGGNPLRVADTLIKAVEAKHPKLRYRIGTGKLLASMEILPDLWLDRIYSLYFNH